MTAAQLSQLTYQGAGGSTVDTVQVRVNDGTVLSSWTSFAVTVPLTIESFGVTSLVQVGNNYFLNPVAGGTGPELNVSGSPVVTGEYSGWTLIGAEQTSTGYDVPGRTQPSIRMPSGPPTAVATTFRTPGRSREPAPRWRTSRSLCSRTSMATV